MKSWWKEKWQEYENQIFRNIMASVLKYRSVSAFHEDYSVHFLDFDADFHELLWPEKPIVPLFSEMTDDSRLTDLIRIFDNHILDENSRTELHRAIDPACIPQCPEGKIIFHKTIINIEQNGVPRFIGYHILYCRDPENSHRVAFVTNVYADVFQKEQELMLRKAQRDQLTGAFNRYMFREVVSDFIAIHGDEPAVLVELDADKFKNINDTWGHDAGDRALVAMTHRMQQVFYRRNQMVLFRLGGDEFAVLLKNMDISEAKRFIDQMMSEPVCVQMDDQKEAISFRISAGFTMLRPSDNIDTFLKRADDALYQVKSRGGGFALSDTDIGG